MTLQTSGAISLNDIQNEFGGANPISLSEYYAGGPYVPAGTTGTNGAVPVSPNPISFSNFYGTSKLILAFNSAADFNLVSEPGAGPAVAEIIFLRDGSINLTAETEVGPTAYTSPLSEIANSLFEFRFEGTVSTSGNSSNVLQVVNAIPSTYTYTILAGPFYGSGTAFSTPWIDLTFSTSGSIYYNYIYIIANATTNGSAAANGTLYIRKKSTLETISRSVYLVASGGG